MFGDILLFLHDIDDIVLCLTIEFGRISIFKSEDIASEFDHHHLHTQANTEGGKVVLTAIASSNELSFSTTLSKAWANDIACHAFKHFGYIISGDVL